MQQLQQSYPEEEQKEMEKRFAVLLPDPSEMMNRDSATQNPVPKPTYSTFKQDLTALKEAASKLNLKHIQENIEKVVMAARTDEEKEVLFLSLLMRVIAAKNDQESDKANEEQRESERVKIVRFLFEKKASKFEIDSEFPINNNKNKTTIRSEVEKEIRSEGSTESRKNSFREILQILLGEKQAESVSKQSKRFPSRSPSPSRGTKKNTSPQEPSGFPKKSR